ncbi:iron complex outermembrane receptor protein [Algoriphagus ratkowskyi]|uniref:Iron complex outermembrane receptor protein n=1 Tax=Algoriphagus ratkowskyi TaxID=57028 RepID=A0A2W7RH47_9BACT|nr:TonB-dependent receptor [Algoriphagus ratkowskyi]PZX58416.1 iron complex outermembrane receptor protein [Algoriphagus ratkowskyi]TXD77717.1 TonB-dependent receptor [Algoriphagus ratkowskyi]
MGKLFTIIFLLISFMTQAQVRIKVVNSKTQTPLENVRVRADNGQNQVSNFSGIIAFSGSEVQTFTFFKSGFEAFSASLGVGEHVVELVEKSLNLSEITVTAFESERPLMEQSAAIALVSEQDFNRFNETSIVNSFNTKPGIRIEERATASYRISIRGSSLRAPFGVRNVKVYWNEVPFTSPDGTTALNLLDLSNIRTAEVIKGPSGSIYGAGNGGVINLYSQANPIGGRVTADFMVGDFGMSRYKLGISQQVGNGGFEASYVSQKADGYREHSAMDRQVFQLGGFFSVTDKQEIRTQLLISDLNYQIPGALNADQLAEDPTQARPGSVKQNSSISQQSVFASIGHLYRFSPKIKNSTTLYMNTNDFENPFILDYKKELGFGFGGRTKFTYDGKLAGKDLRIIAGGEYQTSLTDAQNFGNVNGAADTVRFADKLRATQGFFFQQAEWNLTEDFMLTFALSENFSSMEIDRQIDASGGATGLQTRKFDPIVVPRFALNYQFNDFSGVYGSISSGFSPPTIDEVRTNEGSLNLDLEAEKGINYEVGYRMGKGKLNLDLTAFYFILDQTITTYTNPQGVVLFRNVGSTDQKGIEAAIDYAFIRNEVTFIRDLKIGTSFTGNYFTFKDYQKGDNDFSGNALTGVPETTLVTRLDLRTKPGIYLNFTHQYVSELPLNDANTVYQDAYNLVNLRFGWAKSFAGKWELEAFAGVDNLLNESYSLGNDLNPFGGRYYQPAPTQNWYGGVKVAFLY